MVATATTVAPASRAALAASKGEALTDSTAATTLRHAAGEPVPVSYTHLDVYKRQVEDTSTTGASPLEAANAAREAGATVVAVATIADRATGAAAVFAEAGLPYRFVYGLAELGLA